jgi:hypothetical protein
LPIVQIGKQEPEQQYDRVVTQPEPEEHFMGQVIKLNTLQCVRQFLEKIGICAPVYLPSDEVVALLVSKIKEMQTDPESLRLLDELLAALEVDEIDYGSQLPCPECKTIDPADLLRIIQNTIPSNRPDRECRYAPATLASACALLFFLALQSGCAGSPAQVDNPARSCQSDLSVGHFAQLIAQAPGATPEKVLAASKNYSSNFHPDSKLDKQLISSLCKMSPEEIAKGISRQYNAGASELRSWRERLFSAPVQYSTMYKGVAF